LCGQERFADAKLPLPKTNNHLAAAKQKNHPTNPTMVVLDLEDALLAMRPFAQEHQEHQEHIVTAALVVVVTPLILGSIACRSGDAAFGPGRRVAFSLVSHSKI